MISDINHHLLFSILLSEYKESFLMKLFQFFSRNRSSASSQRPLSEKNSVDIKSEDKDKETPLGLSLEEQRLFNEKKGFFDSLEKDDYFSAVAHLSYLKSVNDPDYTFLKGLYHRYKNELSAAEKEFSSITSDSKYYKDSIHHLILIYSETAQYWKLNELLHTASHESDISKYLSRLNCLLRMDTQELLTERKRIIESGFETIESFANPTETDLHLYYLICNFFSSCLIAAGSIINECSKYQARNAKKTIDFEHDPNLRRHTQSYDKLIYILSLSRYLKTFQNNSDDETTLAYVALSDLSWEDKIKQLGTPQYQEQLARIILDLCGPRMHPKEDRLDLVAGNMQLLAEINPRYIQPIIACNYDLLIDAARNGDSTVKHLLKIAYTDITATHTDKYDLQQRLESVLSEVEDLPSEETVSFRKLAATMSHGAYEKLLEAEEQYFKETKEKRLNIRDESGISLDYFRVIEMEYNNKIIIPLAANTDIEKLMQICGYGKEDIDRNPYEKEMCEKWYNDIKALQSIKDGRKDSLELGTIRTLLDHILAYDKGAYNEERHDACCRALDKSLTPLLSLEGLHAFRTRTMVDIISWENTNEYRGPGAHTGFLPLSSAQEARTIVLENLPIMETWFN